MAKVNLKFSGVLAASDPCKNPVLIVGQLKHLQKLKYDQVKTKFQARVTEQVFRSGISGLRPVPTDSCALYLNLATVVALPVKCTRHNTPSRAHAITKLVKNFSVGVDEYIVIVCEKADAFASACAVARAFPQYNKKTAQNQSEHEVTVEFLLVGCDTEPVTEEDLELMTDVAEGIRLAARIVDTPANEMHTDAFVEEVKNVGEQLGIEPMVITGEELYHQGFGGIYGVGKAAVHPPALAVLSHTPPGATQTVAWVGKGIVYDTGGLSIKTKTTMPGMKRDCGGAAGILGAFYSAVKQGFRENLHAVFCLAENAVGPKATKPDDIHTLYSGRTVEINNTDAEGRLVLADGVAFANKDLKANYIVDMATLTGAQGTTTGKYHGAILTNSETWEQATVQAGKACGDLIFPLVFCPELHFSEFASAIADMKNSVADRSNAQSSCAGLFIYSHIGFDFPGVWMHVDMAYPVHCGERATGYGVSLLCTLFGQFSSSEMLRFLAPTGQENGTEGGNVTKKLRRV